MQGVDIWLHILLTSGLCGSECSTSHRGSEDNPHYPFSRVLCEPGASLSVLEKTESLAPTAIQTPDVPARNLITVLSRSSIIPGIC